MTNKLSSAELSAIIEAAGTGAIGFVFSPGFQKLLVRAREQMDEDERAREFERRMAYKVRCPQCGSRLKLEADYDY